MLKIRLLFATIALLVVAAPAPLSATESGTERDYLHTAHWHQDWEPCFKGRPAGRIVAMRGMDVWLEFKNYLQAADPAEILKVCRRALFLANRRLERTLGTLFTGSPG